MHIVHSLRLNCEDTQDLAQQTLGVALEMLCQIRKQFQHEFQLRRCHSLDDELAIMTEKEEASTAASPLTRLEDHVPIVLGAQALFEDLRVSEVVCEHLFEKVHPIESDLHMLLNL